MTVGEALREATARLGTDWARDEAEMLMAGALGTSRSTMLLSRLRDPAPTGFAALIARRLRDEPVAYILGEAEFFGRTFVVTPDVLIPRADTECVVEAALAAASHARRILDLGTGSGAIIATCLLERPEATGVAVDISAAALRIAQDNSRRLGIADGRARFLCRDWTLPAWRTDLGTFDLVIANPPYVEAGAALDPSVRDYEPSGALFAGPDGLDDYRALIPQLDDLLSQVGVAVFEIGWRQSEAVSAIAREAGFAAGLRHDLAGRPRALILVRENAA